MASVRSQRIRTNIQRVVDKSLRSEESTPDAIYAAVNSIQEIIVETSLCLDGKSDRILFGQEFYSLPDGFISMKEIVGFEIGLIDYSRVGELRRQASGTAVDPMYYYFNDGRIGFLTSSGAYPASGTLTLYYYRQMDDMEYASDTIDPVVDKRWDRALFYGAVCELVQDGAWEKKYEIEFSRRLGRQLQNAVVGRAIPYNASYD